MSRACWRRRRSVGERTKASHQWWLRTAKGSPYLPSEMGLGWARIGGPGDQLPIRVLLFWASQMRVCDGEPHNPDGLGRRPSHRRARLAHTLRAPGAFPSLITLSNRIAQPVPNRNYILITIACTRLALRALETGVVGFAGRFVIQRGSIGHRTCG